MTEVAARVLAVTVPGILSTRDAVAYLGREPVATETWRIVADPSAAWSAERFG
ncbi:hypothetical protein [Curtobacterium sp. KT1]|uniref:hypothetical protein n=1 Tax=Curtobacterium sp. KT1 TaxID=3372858 RepID=UPI0037BE75F5